MNARNHNFVLPHDEAQRFSPSWPIRLEQARGTEHEPAALCLVSDEAKRHGDSEWHDAAEEALSGDWSVLLGLMAEARDRERFEDWQERHDPQGWVTFDEWMAGDYELQRPSKRRLSGSSW